MIIKAPNKSFQPTVRRALWVNASAEFKWLAVKIKHADKTKK